MAVQIEEKCTYRGPTFLERGFRPFFFGAAVFAATAVPAWLGVLGLGFEFPSHLAPQDWHIHEMIFGYVAAVLAGFLLTAVPNWTGRLPVAGRSLAGLFSLWVAGRIATAVSGISGISTMPLIAAIIDVAFLVVLAGVAWREVAAGKNVQNLPICGLVSLLAVANIGFHIAALDESDTSFFQRLALAVISALIILVGGRIIPSFSRNWMVKAGFKTLPAPFDTFDKATMAISGSTLLIWVIFPESMIGASFFGLGALALTIRLLRWRGWTTLGDHLVLVLHVGYAWLPVWFGLMALHGFRPDVIDNSTAMHAMTAGAVGTMTVAVMTRASLGHSGRVLAADRLTTAVYALVVLGAVVRVLVPFLPVGYVPALTVSGLLWSAGFALFAAAYGPMLLGVAKKP